MRATSKADGARNYSSCDSLLLGSNCGAHTFPYMDIRNNTAVVEHEATTSKISEAQLLYCNQRGISTEDAVGLIVNGYAKEVLQKLPMEFAVEAQKLLSVSLEGSVGSSQPLPLIPSRGRGGYMSLLITCISLFIICNSLSITYNSYITK